MPDPIRNIPFARFGFGAVVAGALIGLVTDLVVSLLGFGVALAAYPSEETAAPPLGNLGIAVATVLVGTVASFFTAGYVAAFFAPARRRSEAILHGLSAFALSALAMAFLQMDARAMVRPAAWTVQVSRVAEVRDFGPLLLFGSLGLLLLGGASSCLGAALAYRGAVRSRGRQDRGAERPEAA